MEAVKSKEVIKLCKQANLLLKQNRLPEAKATFLKALQLDGANPYTLVGLGDVTRKTGEFQDSIRYYQEVLKNDPRNIFALRGLGDTFRGLQELDKAIPAWERYLELKPDDYCVLTRLGDAFKKLGDYEKAERFYQETIKINPIDKYAFLGLGDLYYKMNRDEEAIFYCDRLLEIDEENFINILTMVGNIYRRRREYAKAEGYYLRALKVDRNNTYALFGLGDAYRGLGQHERAIETWGQILQYDPRNVNVLCRIGDAFLSLQQDAKAEEFYRRALEIRDNEYAQMGLNKILARQGKHQEAIENFQALLAKETVQPKIAAEMAKVHLDRGENRQAVEVLRSLCRRAEDDFDLSRKLNRVLMDELESRLLGTAPAPVVDEEEEPEAAGEADNEERRR